MNLNPDPGGNLDAKTQGWRCALCRRRCIENGKHARQARRTQWACKVCRTFLCYPTCWHKWHDNLLSPSAAFTSPTAVDGQPSPAQATPIPDELSGGAGSSQKTRAAPKQRTRISRPQKAKSRLKTRRADAAAKTRTAGLKSAREAKDKGQTAKATKASAMRDVLAKAKTGSGKAKRKRGATEASCASEHRRKSPRH